MPKNCWKAIDQNMKNCRKICKIRNNDQTHIENCQQM